MGATIVVDTVSIDAGENAPKEVSVLRLVDDSDQGGAPPVGAVDGEAFVVNNWGAGNYVGTHAGTPYANGDLAEYNATLAGYVLILANVGGALPAGTRAIVVGAGAAGSFAGHGNEEVEYDGTGYEFLAPTDGDLVNVTADESIWTDQIFQYNLGTTSWRSVGRGRLTLANTVYVDGTLGDDDSGDGTFERPYGTIQNGHDQVAAGGTVYAAPGVYAETVTVAKNINIKEIIPGTVTIQDAVVGGGVVVIAGAALNVQIDASIVNTNNATATDIALEIDAGGGAIDVRFHGQVINAGGNGTAIDIDGDAVNVCTVRVEAQQIIGGVNFDGGSANDLFRINGTEFTGGAAAWITITGAGGQVILSNGILADAGSGETIDYGGGVACGVNLDIGSCAFAAFLNLNSDAGTGQVVLTAGTQLGGITVTFPQLIQKWLGEDEISLTYYGIDANAVAATTIYTVPAGRRFNPHTVRTINRGAATGGALNYRVNGTGAGSIVAAVGAGAVAQGIVNETVVQDSVAPGGTVQFDETAGSGAAGDLVDCQVIGRLF